MNTDDLKKKFWFGTHYYRPPSPPQMEWEDDFKRLKDFNLQIIQARVFWRWHERKRGTFVWDDLDRFMDLAGKYDLGVVHQITLENAPQYVFDELHGYRIDHRGLRIWPVAMAGMYPGGWIPCFDNPAVMESSLIFVRKLVERFRNH